MVGRGRHAVVASHQLRQRLGVVLQIPSLFVSLAGFGCSCSVGQLLAEANRARELGPRLALQSEPLDGAATRLRCVNTFGYGERSKLTRGAQFVTAKEVSVRNREVVSDQVLVIGQMLI